MVHAALVLVPDIVVEVAFDRVGSPNTINLIAHHSVPEVKRLSKFSSNPEQSMTYLSMLRVGCSPCISIVQAEAEMTGWQPLLISSTSLVSLIIQWEVESLESETESTFLSFPLCISGLDTTCKFSSV